MQETEKEKYRFCKYNAARKYFVCNHVVLIQKIQISLKYEKISLDIFAKNSKSFC